MNIISFLSSFMAEDKNNTGTDNSGNRNSGYGNSGNRNSGDWNSGNRNSGFRNSGDWNSGYGNSGDWNSGYGNSGDWNSGDWNSGYGNSGYGNSGDWNSGAFCTGEPFAMFFNKPTNIKLSEFVISESWPDFSEMNPCVWINDSIMTQEEKTKYPSYKTTGGYLKTLSYKDAWAVWRRKTSEENWNKVLALPNFDPAIWEEITGIKVSDDSNKRKAQELEEEATKLLAKAKELRESL